MVFVKAEIFGDAAGLGGNKLNSIALTTAHVKIIY